ncbi:MULTISPECIES: phosphoglycolate phosphatase [unclassified Ruegeria]|uniref:phosphoglycolate phosphatase n=1 Tax=unclassified Ruegeria TaxID=2625375 RepID=UPI00148779DD|nr:MULTISPECIES: phosphoglycolate phosphatase [unclassified Ruegeria]NOD35334.1 phosphoglycolate phosphatase [Ruegeria sp. HKCCD7296]NOD49017.1 phosphoglycolate phosphatase [Ruegeria sp. HKCCD5849]NOD53664.1 phosphoglycolate phosphatase [Ruegeria sp. HKCCD5851]NOD69540.1 phosphoglycolate phosphatase [Ruegeria sp. HKCCD7303]NOE42902.1 phosphoglycolate phosphatase [Ruegeria sp. HKCCD7319]
MTATVIFDLDGTLVDSLGDLAAAANRTLNDVGHDPLSIDIIKGFVGNGLPKLVERMIHHCELPLDRHAELTQLTLKHYNAAASETTIPYPGIPESLDALRQMGCALGICTNKPEAPARHVLEALNLSRFFDVVIGGDSLPTRKPDPKHLFASFDALEAKGPRVFVGDSEVDSETAVRAKIPFLLFTEGYRKSRVQNIPHDIAYEAAADLPIHVATLAQNEHVS